MEKKENQVKIIFHIDMNAFFCSVACILDPSLRGKAFAIGRENSYKGVISTCSYEARRYKIHSGMPLIDAFKLLPSLIVVNPRYSIYQEYHEKFISVVSGYTNIIEVASIDEVYADMTEISKTKHPVVLAKEIQARLMKEHSLPSSIGIAPTRFLAKMASDIKKPLGVTVLRKRDVESILYPIGVSDIYGIGKKTYPKLIENGIKTIGDFANINNRDRIIELIGENQYTYVMTCIQGKSSNVVDPDRYSDSNSISTSVTFDVFKTTIDELAYVARGMTRELIGKLKKENYFTKTVVLTLRDHNFTTFTRRKTLDDYTDDFYVLYDVITELIEEYYDDSKSYRLLGVGYSNLIDRDSLPREYNLFTITDELEKENKLRLLIKQIQDKYGDNAISRGEKKEK